MRVRKSYFCWGNTVYFILSLVWFDAESRGKSSIDEAVAKFTMEYGDEPQSKGLDRKFNESFASLMNDIITDHRQGNRR